MKRRDLLRRLAAQAWSEGRDLVQREGANHTKVQIGDRRSVVPRHAEINELTAAKILEQMGVTR